MAKYRVGDILTSTYKDPNNSFYDDLVVVGVEGNIYRVHYTDSHLEPKLYSEVALDYAEYRLRRYEGLSFRVATSHTPPPSHGNA